MKVERIGDVVAWAQALHSRLAQCLGHCATEHAEQRAQWLLSYLADHESELSLVISGLSPAAGVLDTWIYDYLDHAPVEPHQSCDQPFVSMAFDDICQAVFDLHNQAIKLFQNLVTRTDIPSTREFIAQLLAIEEHETMRLAQQVNRIRDL